MAVIDKSNINELYARSSMKAMDLLGLVFLGVGVAGFLGVRTGSGGSEGFFFNFVFFGIFAIVGLLFTFGRRYIHIEKNSNMVYTWFGVFGIGLKFGADISGVDLLSLKKETRGSGKNRRTVNVLRLSPVTGASSKSCEIMTLLDYVEAREIAEAVARFLDVSLCDYVAGGGIKRAPETLDWSVRERLTRTGQVPAMPQHKKELNVDYEVQGNNHRFILPVRGFSLDTVVESIVFTVVAFVAVPMAVVVLYMLNSDPAIPPVISIGGTGFILFAAGMGIMYAVLQVWASAYGHEEIVVSRDKVILESHGMFSFDAQELPAEEIEEVIPERTGGNLILRSDRKVLLACEGHSKEIIRYLRTSIEHVLCS
jgi:hypothetical protein